MTQILKIIFTKQYISSPDKSHSTPTMGQNLNSSQDSGAQLHAWSSDVSVQVPPGSKNRKTNVSTFVQYFKVCVVVLPALF